MIGDVAQQVGLSLRTVRYYEEMGLVNPSSRTQGGFRLYSEDDVRRLYILKGMKPAGMTLEEIRELMNLLDRTESLSDPSDVAGLLAGLREYEARTEEAIDRLERHLVEVRKLRDRIRKRMSACEAWLLETVEQPG
jgi:DNA-binding transcriptional MerR regulator